MTDRRDLFEIKLRGLVRATGTELELTDSPGQAGGVSASGARDSVGYLLAEGDGVERMIGPALLWATKRALDSVMVLAPAEPAGHLARRAAHFTATDGPGGPSIEVLAVVGTDLVPAASAPVATVPVLSPGEWALAGLINETGARAVDDHGRLVAEFAGLEVGRVSVDDTGSPWLEVGVGQADRELHQLVHRDLAPDEGLRHAINAVAPHRRPGASPHPLNRLARERWLRSFIADDPARLDLTEAHMEAPLRPRETLLGTQAVALRGRDRQGRSVVVVCSVGFDVDVAAEAADYRHRIDPEADLVVVLPAADRLPILDQLIGRLERARIVSLTPPWVEAV